jgi:hypothetical protein
MNWTTDYPPNAMTQPQLQSVGVNRVPAQEPDAKPAGLTATLNALRAEVYEAANLAENLASSLGLSAPKGETGAQSELRTPIEFVHDAMRIMREANEKLTGVLQHINS